MQDLIRKAEVLIEALPYIQEFRGSIFIIKYGGSAMVEDELKESVLLDVLLLQLVGIQVVIVHGGGKQISKQLDKLGKKPTFIDGLRVTDSETMDIVEMVLAGKVNKEIVSSINRQGGHAVGLTGKDDQILIGRRKESEVDLGHVGEIDKINCRLLNTLLQQDYIPVIAPIGIGVDGETLNLNADTVAGRLAGVLKARKLILLTDEPGVLRQPGELSSLIPTITSTDFMALRKSGVIDGGMIPKVESCLAALQEGVEKVHIISGKVRHSILLEIFTTTGIGTEIIL